MPTDLKISKLLRAWSQGDRGALNGLTPIVYKELRRLAHRYMECERPGYTLQTTALVNQAYMRLVDYKRMQWQDRAVDHTRSHNIKRGGGVPHFSLDDGAVVSGDRTGDLVALYEAINALPVSIRERCKSSRMRFFGGRSVQEAAEVLNVSPATVRRDWSIAKFWLYRELGGGTADGLGTVEATR